MFGDNVIKDKDEPETVEKARDIAQQENVNLGCILLVLQFSENKISEIEKKTL